MREANMSMAVSKLESKIAEMRRLFDESFAVALAGQVATPEPMLAITVEGERFAFRVSEISGLAVSEEKIVAVPSRVPELLGLTGIRGKVVPVFSLARLLGFAVQRGPVRWLIFCGERQAPMALAFEAMERLFEVSTTDIFDREEASGHHRFMNSTVCEGTTLRGVLSIPAVVEYIKGRGASEHHRSKSQSASQVREQGEA